MFSGLYPRLYKEERSPTEEGRPKIAPPRRRTPRNTMKLKAASPDQIRAQLKQDYVARQSEWRLGLTANRVDCVTCSACIFR